MSTWCRRNSDSRRTMLFFLLQKALFLFFYCEISLQAQGGVIKRSPLEFGYVTFPSEVEKHRNGHVVRKFSEDVQKHTVGISDTSTAAGKLHHTHIWVPGHIRGHSYIPAHTHHIYIPVLVTREEEESSLFVDSEDDLFYPKHYGGFGLGTYSGGQGAGNGYQIVFNDLNT